MSTDTAGHGHGRDVPKAQGHDHGHGHSHGLVSRSIVSSRAGLRAVSWSLLVLLITTVLQLGVFVLTGSVALLADLIHNFGDALTAVPLGIAFLLRSFKAEKRAGYFVVATIFVSACVALWQSIERLINPQQLDYLWPLAAAGVIGFIGNEIAAQIRTRAGRWLDSPALIADGAHARTDGFVSLSVVASAIVVALGLNIGDPIIGLIITLVILRITWQSFITVQRDPGTELDVHDDAAGQSRDAHGHDQPHQQQPQAPEPGRHSPGTPATQLADRPRRARARRKRRVKRAGKWWWKAHWRSARTELFRGRHDVPGVSCAHCENAIRDEVRQLAGVRSVDVDLGSKRVTVRGEQLDDDAVRDAIAEAGYDIAA